jgi:hypothetical protein
MRSVSTHFILHDLIITIISRWNNEARYYAVHFHPPVTSSSLGPNILNTLRSCILKVLPVIWRLSFIPFWIQRTGRAYIKSHKVVKVAHQRARTRNRAPRACNRHQQYCCTYSWLLNKQRKIINQIVVGLMTHKVSRRPVLTLFAQVFSNCSGKYQECKLKQACLLPTSTFMIIPISPAHISQIFAAEFAHTCSYIINSHHLNKIEDWHCESKCNWTDMKKLREYVLR